MVLEGFLGQCLHRTGVWRSPRVSDGIVACRVVVADARRLRACGRLWEIDQTQHAFWLDLEDDPLEPDCMRWTLHYDIVRSSRRSHATVGSIDAIEQVDRPEQIEWRITSSGVAHVEDGVWVPEPAEPARRSQ
jgi:hypothetical protein